MKSTLEDWARSSMIVRELQLGDLWNGFLSSLDTLRTTSNISRELAKEIFEDIDVNKNHIIAVAEVDGRVVGAATLLIEPKFIHGGGIAGHIEDVVVDQDYQGKRIGREIIEYLLNKAADRGCYKTILDCSSDVKPFYEKIGFVEHGTEMRFDHN